jgi:putative selenate reductase
MAELRPYPFGALIKRIFGEMTQADMIFDLPLKKCVFGHEQLDLSVMFHGARAANPFGPAAGPQTQMAQNIVLSWLAGGRIIELKTIQINDELVLPRPCIDMETVGYNVEWSQELKVEESIDEYVKGSMLIDMLSASGRLPLQPGFEETLFDMSVGYDLAGIQSPKVQHFIDTMRDATEVVERLRQEIPEEFKQYRDLNFRTELSNTLTLSTFHGCPPHEIEQIIDFLLKEKGIHCIVKLNPTLLGPERARGILNDQLGYTDVHIPDSAFKEDTGWDQAVGIVSRLKETAEGLDLGLGVKLTNTLIVKNHRQFFPSEEQVMYLSGVPLHVLSMNLSGRFRETFGGELPISFSAGIDRQNFADAVSLGLVPITVCSDLLKPGGYGRGTTYFRRLHDRMEKAGASCIDDYVIKAWDNGATALDNLGLDAGIKSRCLEALQSSGDLQEAAGEAAYTAWVEATKVRNTASYLEVLNQDPRYHSDKNQKVPKKIDSHLVLFDCITCDKCIPVCPNDANFTLPIPPQEIPVVKLRKEGDTWHKTVEEPTLIERKHQIANFADFCNECGNCDIFCPEYGGPYIMKPRFFGSLGDWEEMREHDGFFLERSDGTDVIWGRFSGNDYTARFEGEQVLYTGAGFSVRFDLSDPLESLDGEAEGEVDLTFFFMMDALMKAAFNTDTIHYLNAPIL